MRSVWVPIEPEILDELKRLADRDLRTHRDEAAYLLRDAIARAAREAPVDRPRRDSEPTDR